MNGTYLMYHIILLRYHVVMKQYYSIPINAGQGDSAALYQQSRIVRGWPNDRTGHAAARGGEQEHARTLHPSCGLRWRAVGTALCKIERRSTTDSRQQCGPGCTQVRVKPRDPARLTGDLRKPAREAGPEGGPGGGRVSGNGPDLAAFPVRARASGAGDQPSFRWQAAWRPGAISRSAGASSRQRAVAWGQRGWK